MGKPDDVERGWPHATGFMATLVRNHDWGATSLGSSATWSTTIRSAVEMMLATPGIASLAIGPRRILLYNDAAAHLYGDCHPRALGRGLFETFTREEQAVAPYYDRVFAGEGVIVPEHSIAADEAGHSELFESRLTPIWDDRGNVVAAFMMGSTIGERRRAEQALAAAEHRQRALIEGMPQLVWRAVGEGQWTWASPQWTEFTGQTDPQSRGWGWLQPLHPDDRPKAREAWSRALRDGALDAEYRICHLEHGTYRWFHTRASPVRNDAGEIVEWLGTSTDVDDLRSLQGRQQVLVAELQHRTRNLMGVVRSIANRTAATSQDLPDFEQRFLDRLDALARAQDLLSRLEHHDRVTFDELVQAEISAMNSDSSRVSLRGPSGVRLRSGTVQTLAMALHELATNAVKYGAFRQPGAHLEIHWHLGPLDKRGRPCLNVDWRERGVVMPKDCSGGSARGGGRQLIETALPYQLKAKTAFSFENDGVHCTIALPVSSSNVRDNGEAS